MKREAVLLIFRPSHFLLRRDNRRKSDEVPGYESAPELQADLWCYFKMYNSVLESCGAGNLEQMTKTDNFGTTGLKT